MCGLAGWFGDCNVSDHQRLRRARALESLLVANAERGTDATGVGMVHNGRPLTIYKRPVNSYRMLQDQYFTRIIRADDAEMAIGHTRYKTMGVNKVDNAHPFLEGAILGAHNGMITNYAELENLYSEAKYPTLRVDSQAAFRMLDRVTPEGKAYASALEMIDGSMALSWHDVRDTDALWVFKHWNPLHIAIVPTIRSMFWSSQPEHLAIAMQAAYGNRWETFRIKEDTLYRLTWHPTKDTLLYEEFIVDMPSWSDKYRYRGPATQSGKKNDNKITVFPQNSGKGSEDTDKERSIVFDNEFETCDMCKKNVDWEDEDATYLQDDAVMMCGECMRWWEDQGMYTYGNQMKDAIDVMRSIGYRGNYGYDH